MTKNDLDIEEMSYIEKGLRELEVRSKLLCLNTKEDVYIINVSQGIIFVTKTQFNDMFNDGFKDFLNNQNKLSEENKNIEELKKIIMII